jgi:SAM-dependent methyltransferase
MSARTTYVRAVQGARDVADRTGLLARLEGSARRPARYLRSLFSIYDAEDLAALDLPWWSFASIDRVERFLAGRPDARVFEYGAGASTAWLARRAASVTSVEHDERFLPVARRIAAPYAHASVRLVPPRRPPDGRRPAVGSERAGFQGLDFADYVHAIDDAGGPFDLVVVDGRARLAALRHAVPHLAPDGLIVFDDVERRRYAPALHEPGLRALVLRGLTPAVPYPAATALLRREAT